MTPKQAEQLALVTELGQLSLSLRSLKADTTKVETETVTVTPEEAAKQAADLDGSAAPPALPQMPRHPQRAQMRPELYLPRPFPMPSRPVTWTSVS